MNEYNLGSEMRHKRKCLGLLVKTVAYKVGVSSKTISMWESGQRFPRYKHLVKWREALGSAGETAEPVQHQSGASHG